MENLPKAPIVPKIEDLYADTNLAKSNDLLMSLLNQPPNPEWVKIHPYIAGYKYLPIDKIEYLLKKIFKKYRIEILREGYCFNGVYVVVRVWYLNPITNEFDYHDGIGAKELQVKKGMSAADLSAINSGALQMAFPIAKTVAIKDACDHFGTLFGSDLNRKDVMFISPDEKLNDKSVIEKINESVSLPDNQKILPATESVNDIEVVGAEIISPVREPLFDTEGNLNSSPAPAPATPIAPATPVPAPVNDYDDF